MLNAAACIKANEQNIYQKGLSNQVWYNHLHEHCAITKKKKWAVSVDTKVKQLQ